MASGIYAIVNLVTGSQYIGSASNLKNREAKHFSHMKCGTHKNPHLQAAYRKYGQVFEFRLLELVDDVEGLLPAEQFWIDAARVLGIDLYNIRPVAENNRGFRHTAESRQKISDSRKGKGLGLHAGHFHWVGRKHSSETLVKMRKPKPAGFADNMRGSNNPNFRHGQYQVNHNG